MKTDRPEYLPSKVKWNSASTEEELAIHLTQDIKQMFIELIDSNMRSSLAVSGGSTPINLFQKVSKLNIQWESIDITLIDDRWVEPTHKDSNELLVRKNLLRNNALNANFIPLKNSSNSAKDGQALSEKSLGILRNPLDLAILGMGNDGHTASLFPCSEDLPLAMDINNKSKCIAVNPNTAPYERISLTRSMICKSRNIVLYIVGEQKLETLEKAIKNKDPNIMPIYAFLEHGLSIYWSP